SLKGRRPESQAQTASPLFICGKERPMATRALPIMTAVLLGIALTPLAGCERDISSVHAEKDAKGKTQVQVDREKIDQNLKQAQKDLGQAGRQIKEGVEEGARQVGIAVEEGAKKIDA